MQSKNASLKQDSRWATELISGMWGQHTNLNSHTSLRKELTKQLPLKDKKKKHYPATWQDYDRASAYIPTWRLDAGGVTPELKLRLIFYSSWTWRFVCVCLFVLFLVSLCLFVHLSLLITLGFLFCFVLLVLILWLANTKLQPDQGQKQHTHTKLKTQCSQKLKLNQGK
jgi:hypothetical protein